MKKTLLLLLIGTLTFTPVDFKSGITPDEPSYYRQEDDAVEDYVGEIQLFNASPFTQIEEN